LQELSSSNQPQKDSPDRNSPLNFKYKMNILDKIIVDKKEEKSFKINSFLVSHLQKPLVFSKDYILMKTLKNSTTGNYC
jgi:hypothetical protein